MKIIKQNYTLIELLIVIAIAIILIGLVVPAFNTMTKGSGVELAARNVCSQLKATRISAITKGKYMALIIPTTEGVPSDYRYRSYRTCIVNDSGAFQEWLYGSKWEFLPIGAAILDVNNSPGYGGGGFTGASSISSVDFSDIGGGSSASAKGIIFTPAGKAGGVRKYVVVGDSVVLESGVSSTSNQVDITIDQYTGRISYGSD